MDDTSMKFKRLFALLLLAMGLIVANAAEAVVGDKGPVGDKGLPGNKGLPGDKGLPGAKGLPGDKGLPGAKGLPGDKGLTGNKGLPGDKGLTGNKGLPGAKGDQGLPGDKGLQGDKGDAGTNGTNGDKGLPGDKGLQGDKGDAGTQIANGTTTGDMLYWDETQIKWVVLPAPNPLPIAPAKATLSFCNGVPTWVKNCVPVNTGVYQIGETGQAGGIVFYVTDGGLHGMEAAPVDQSSSADWGCANTIISGAQATSVGSGIVNTDAILASCNEVNIAARIATSYSLNGFNDWYLPSQDELALLYSNQNIIGGFSATLYWSSSDNGIQNNNPSAWTQVFASGYQKPDAAKSNKLPIRAIRSF